MVPETALNDEALAAAGPDDPEVTGEATFARRDERTIAAFEQVTGRSREQLDRELQAWFQTKVGRQDHERSCSD